MESSDGMVAVVRGLPDAALAVTLLEGGRQYTLMPNAAPHPPVPPYVQVSARHEQFSKMECQDSRAQAMPCDSTAQAVDGRYASVYKMTHCNVMPTSPPVQLTEFPPQRAELCRGLGNFEVGGTGSGESSFSPTRANSSFRGGMSWPDRGSVFTPRPSHEPDAFANSLRKYPSMSPERSAEIVERLINYTQMKNGKNSPKSQTSPSRSDTASTQSSDRRNLGPRPQQRSYEPEVSVRSKVEEPTKDAPRMDLDCLECRRSMYSRNYDVRCLGDSARRSFKNISTYPFSHSVCPSIKERYDHLPPQRRLTELNSSNSVNMETQADIAMVSREVSTLPREQPSTRNVAVPLSPSISKSDSPTPKPSDIKAKCSCKSIQTKHLDHTLRKSAETCFSNVEVHKASKKRIKSGRKTKSQEELRGNNHLEEELLQIIKDFGSNFDTDIDIRNGLLRKLRKIHKSDRNDGVKIKFSRCLKDHMYSEFDFKDFTRDLSNELVAKLKNDIFVSSYPTNLYRADFSSPFKIKREENDMDELIKEWLCDIPIKTKDYIGRNIKKEHVLHTVANKIKTLIMNKVNVEYNRSLKTDIFEIIEDMPIDVNGHNKTYYLNRLTNELVKKIENICCFDSIDRKRWLRSTDMDKSYRYEFRNECRSCNYIQPTEEDLRQFVCEELLEFTIKFRLKICPKTIEELQIELIDVLIDSDEAIRVGKEDQIKEEILIILSDLVNITEQQAVYFTNNLIYNLKDMYNKSKSMDQLPHTFIVMQNSLQNTTMQTKNIDFSIEGITNEDINANLDAYTKQITQQVYEWMTNIPRLNKIDSDFKQVVVKDLTEDIVDRHKYLELNPNSTGSESDELEHLKYQIFKWVNKLVGEDDLEIIEHASTLMQKIRNIPVPMLTKPVQNVSISLPSCCQNHQELMSTYEKNRRNSSPNEPSSSKGQSSELREGKSPATMYSTQNSSCNHGVNKSSGITDNSNPGVSDNPPISNLSTENQNTLYTEPNINQNQMPRPQGASMSMVQPPKERSDRRRFSEPATSKATATGTSQPSDRQLRRSVNPMNSDLPPCCRPKTDAAVPSAPTLQQLNDEYDIFLKNWVQKIPIVATNDQEQEFAEKARLGIYNGLWKAITKLKMNPATLNNAFYFQDCFDDEIEELIDLLPQTSELVSKKQTLKAQLMEKTTNINDQIAATVAPSSYKQQLVDSINNYMPRRTVDHTGEDVAQVVEEMHKIYLAEDFILYINYREGNRVKANVYKKKLMKHIEEFIDVLKKTSGKEFTDIDIRTYRDELMTALEKVPTPSEDTIREEADEILLGIEVEQWFGDLPLFPTEDYVEVLARRRHRHNLARKIHEMEKLMNLPDWEDKVKHETVHFLEKLPLRPGEEQNMNFMAEELVNRVKNRGKDVLAGSGGRRKAVAFLDPYDYDEFSRDMQLCSSFSDSAGTKRAQINSSSYMIVGGERVNASYNPYANVNYTRNTPESQQEWLTLEDSQAPKVSPQGRSETSKRDSLPPCCKTQQAVQTLGPGSQFRDTLESQQKWLTLEDSLASKVLPQDKSEASKRDSLPPCCKTQQAIQSSGPGSSRLQMVTPQQVSSSSQTPIPGLAIRDSIGPTSYPGIRPQSPDILRSASPGQPYQLRPEGFSNQVSQGTDAGYPSPHRQSRSFEMSTQPPISYGPQPSTGYQEGSTRPYGTQPDQSERIGYSEGRFGSDTPECCIQPIGFSTPEQNVPPPRESRPKKRIREVEGPRREAARRRLDLEDTEDEGEEVRCRCMERVWRCRKKRPVYFSCEDFDDFPPCYPMRFPYPYFF